MATRTINGNNAGNTINVLDFSATTGSGYKVTGASSISPAGSAPFFDTDLYLFRGRDSSLRTLVLLNH